MSSKMTGDTGKRWWKQPSSSKATTSPDKSKSGDLFSKHLPRSAEMDKSALFALSSFRQGKIVAHSTQHFEDERENVLRAKLRRQTDTSDLLLKDRIGPVSYPEIGTRRDHRLDANVAAGSLERAGGTRALKPIGGSGPLNLESSKSETGKEIPRSNQSADIVHLSGEIIVDGRRLGQIVAKSQASGLSAAPASSGAVNLRSTPLNPGVNIPIP